MTVLPFGRWPGQTLHPWSPSLVSSQRSPVSGSTVCSPLLAQAACSPCPLEHLLSRSLFLVTGKSLQRAISTAPFRNLYLPRAREYGFALTKSFATDALFFISMVSLPCSSRPLPVVLDAWDVFSYLMPFFSLALPYSRFLPSLLFWLLPLPVVAQARVSLVLPMCWASLSTLAISHRQCLTLLGPRASDQTR